MWKHSSEELARTLCVRPSTVRPLTGAADADQTIDAFRARLQVALFTFAAATNLNENAKTAVLVLPEDVAVAIRRLHPSPATAAATSPAGMPLSSQPGVIHSWKPTVRFRHAYSTVSVPRVFHPHGRV